MGSLIGGLLSGGLSGIINSVGGVIKSVWGDKSARDQYSHMSQMAVQDSYAAEFMAPEKTHWFNMLVDGLNRLVRPLFTYGIIIMFWWAATSPEQFIVYIKTLQIVPESMWYIMWTIIAFWFGGRILENRSLPSSRIDPAIAGQIFRDRQDGAMFQNNNQPIIRPIAGDAQFNKELADTKKTLSNPAIAEWNRRNNPNYRP